MGGAYVSYMYMKNNNDLIAICRTSPSIQWTHEDTLNFFIIMEVSLFVYYSQGLNRITRILNTEFPYNSEVLIREIILYLQNNAVSPQGHQQNIIDMSGVPAGNCYKQATHTIYVHTLTL